MALSEDQRALLDLLDSGESYERIADLLGTSIEDVEARAAAARAERGPEERLGPRPQAEEPRRRLPWALWAVIAAGAVILVVVLVIAIPSGGGGGSGGEPTVTSDQEDAVTVHMMPVGGSKASGTITVVRVADQPAVDLALRGLIPSGPGQSYVLWFVGGGGQQALPVAFHPVGSDGRLQGRTPIPDAATGLLPNFDTAEVTLSSKSDAAASVRTSATAGHLPQVIGNPVLRGALR